MLSRPEGIPREADIGFGSGELILVLLEFLVIVVTLPLLIWTILDCVRNEELERWEKMTWVTVNFKPLTSHIIHPQWRAHRQSDRRIIHEGTSTETVEVPG